MDRIIIYIFIESTILFTSGEMLIIPKRRMYIKQNIRTNPLFYTKKWNKLKKTISRPLSLSFKNDEFDNNNNDNNHQIQMDNNLIKKMQMKIVF